MIRELRLEHFKRFAGVSVPCSNLTVLTGTNGAGKTSILHALLLARQAALQPANAYVQLNDGDTIQLGEAAELIHRAAGVDAFDTFAITTVEDGEHRWVMEVPEEERALMLRVSSRPEQYAGALAKPSPQFTYLCAERFGPRDVQVASSIELERLGPGTHGELTAQVLATRERYSVSEKRRSTSSTSPRLPHQVEAWMCEIVRPIAIEAQWVPGTLVTTLRFKVPGVQSEWTRPANMGFGVSYALPIIVAGLLIGEDGTLIVENPEAHLHPAAQSRIGAFLARVAADGAQVIVETHSDHVLNGIRRAVADDKVLAADRVAVNFFHDDNPRGEPIQPLSLTENGQLSAWPPGFFDQTQRDLSVLARVKRSPR